MPRTPVVVLSTMDPVVRDAAVLALVADRPRTVVLRHDLRDDGLRRTVLCAGGVVEEGYVELGHGCIGCAVRADIVPALARLARDPRWDAVLLALPVSADSLPVARAVARAAQPGGPLEHVRLASVATAQELDGFDDDLLGGDLLVEWGLGFSEADRRPVAEAVAAQVAHADVVLVLPGAGPRAQVASDLLDHVRARDGRRVDLFAADPGALLRTEHDVRRGACRTDPRCARPVPGAPEGAGVWTLDLRSPLPVHPERFVEHVGRLGVGRLHGRGCFWVPSRPGSACAWHGVGGQVAVGSAGRWGGRVPQTRLVVTGVDDVRSDVLEAFAEVLLTPGELAAGPEVWRGRRDVLEPWLGQPERA